MSMGSSLSRRAAAGLGYALAFVLLCSPALGQSGGSGTTLKTDPASAAVPKQTPGASPDTGNGVLVDQVVAVVNGDPILESDIEEERRFQAFEPVRALGPEPTRDATIERLIDRQLILQQAALQQDGGVSTVDAEKELLALRKEIPACRQYHCETDAGWARFVHDQGFTEPELVSRWKQRTEILKYVELRFRSGVIVSPTQIKTYYTDTLLPEYARRNAVAPPLSAVSARIGEVLLEQQVTRLLEDWLKSLKAEGNVRVIKPQGAEG